MMRIVLLLSLIIALVNAGTSSPYNMPPLRVGMVKDNMQKNAPNDLQIYLGVSWWSQWIQDQGGLKYPAKLFSLPSFFFSFLSTHIICISFICACSHIYL